MDVLEVFFVLVYFENVYLLDVSVEKVLKVLAALTLLGVELGVAAAHEHALIDLLFQ